MPFKPMAGMRWSTCSDTHGGRRTLWADRYDGAVEDVFDLQDHITDQVVGIVEPSLQRSEIERSRRASGAGASA